MDERIKKVFDSQRSKERSDQDGFVDIGISNDKKIIPKSVVNKVVDLGEKFDEERQESSLYRILGTLNPVISNPLFDLTGDTSWSTFNTDQLRDQSYPSDGDPDIDYFEALDRYLEENNGWFGYTNDDLESEEEVCQFITMKPSRDEFRFNVVDAENNWDLTVTYPYTATTGYLVNGGLLIIDDFSVDVGGRDLVAFATPLKHNLSGGDKISISGLSPSSLDGEYRIERRGSDNGNLKEHYFAVDIDPSNLSSSDGARFKKVIGGFESEYYYRVFKKAPTANNGKVNNGDYEIYKPAFTSTVYNDEVTQFVFNEEIDVSDIRDNLGRPISELYVTVIKKDNKGFTKLRSGFEMPYMFDATSGDTNIEHINRITNSTSTHDFLEDNITINDDEFIGDAVEYNVSTLREDVIGNVAYRFNRESRTASPTLTINGTDYDIGPRHEGYYYLPHILYKIREFSTYIEQGGVNTVGIPDYAENLGDGRYLWRDLMSVGFTSGEEDRVNYPFLNGIHYLHSCNVFHVRRQDAFNQFGLYYANSNNKRIRDPFGVQMVDEFDVNRSEDVC